MGGIRSNWQTNAPVGERPELPEKHRRRGPTVDHDFIAAVKEMCGVIGIDPPTMKLGKLSGYELGGLVQQMNDGVIKAETAGRTIDPRHKQMLALLELISVETMLQEALVRVMHSTGESVMKKQSDFLRERWR
jgi:hypothetical protein